MLKGVKVNFKLYFMFLCALMMPMVWSKMNRLRFVRWWPRTLAWDCALIPPLERVWSDKENNKRTHTIYHLSWGNELIQNKLYICLFHGCVYVLTVNTSIPLLIHFALYSSVTFAVCAMMNGRILWGSCCARITRVHSIPSLTATQRECGKQ